MKLVQKFKNPQNNYVEEVTGYFTWLWAFLIPPLYFLIKGMWKHALLSLIFQLITLSLASFVYAFIVYGLVRKHYLRLGWEEIKQ